MAATRSDEGQRQCCLDNVRIWSSGPCDEVRWPRQKSPQVERRRARLPVTRQAAPSQRCQTKTLRPTGAPLPLGGRKEMKAAPRAWLLPGPMNHVRINDADVMRHRRAKRRRPYGYGAGCLTCESETTGAGRSHRRHSGAARSAEPGIQNASSVSASGFRVSLAPPAPQEADAAECSAKLTAPE